MASSRKEQTVMTVAVVAALWLFGLGVVSAQQGAATRSFDKSSVAPGNQVVVTVAATGYGGFGALIETLPPGFSYVSSTHSDAAANGQEVSFTLFGDSSVTYTVTAPTAEGTYRFHGTLIDEDKNDHPVGGASEITVGVVTSTPTPSPTPTPTPTPTPQPTTEPTPTPTPTASPTATPEPTTEPTPTPPATAAPTATPEPTTEPTPTPTVMLAPTPTPSSAPSPEPTATPARAPTATPTSAPEGASTVTPASSPTARPTPTPLPTVPVVSVDAGGGMPAWVVPAVVVAALLALIAGAGVFITSRQRQR